MSIIKTKNANSRASLLAFLIFNLEFLIHPYLSSFKISSSPDLYFALRDFIGFDVIST
jgi:hypothetical protein